MLGAADTETTGTAARRTYVRDRQRARYSQDPDYRERTKRKNRVYWRSANHGEGPGPRFRTYSYDPARIQESAKVSPRINGVTGLILHDEPYVSCRAMGLALGVSEAIFSHWVLIGCWPFPLYRMCTRTLRPVFSVPEAMEYARIFTEALAGQPTARPFSDRPELVGLLHAARERLMAQLSLAERAYLPERTGG